MKGIMCYTTNNEEWGKYIEISGRLYNSEISIIVKREKEEYIDIKDNKYKNIKPLKIKELFKAYKMIDIFETETKELEKYKYYSEEYRLENPILCWVDTEKEENKIAWIYEKCCYYGDREYTYKGIYRDIHYKKIKVLTKEEIVNLIINILELDIYKPTKNFKIKLNKKSGREEIKKILKQGKEDLQKEIEEYFSESINKALIEGKETIKIEYKIEENKYNMFYGIEKEIKEYFVAFIIKELKKESLIKNVKEIKEDGEEYSRKSKYKIIIEVNLKG